MRILLGPKFQYWRTRKQEVLGDFMRFLEGSVSLAGTVKNQVPQEAQRATGENSDMLRYAHNIRLVSPYYPL
jgi:hypothetical protein